MEITSFLMMNSSHQSILKSRSLQANRSPGEASQNEGTDFNVSNNHDSIALIVSSSMADASKEFLVLNLTTNNHDSIEYIGFLSI